MGPAKSQDQARDPSLAAPVGPGDVVAEESDAHSPTEPAEDDPPPDAPMGEDPAPEGGRSRSPKGKRAKKGAGQ